MGMVVGRGRTSSIPPPKANLVPRFGVTMAEAADAMSRAVGVSHGLACRYCRTESGHDPDGRCSCCGAPPRRVHVGRNPAEGFATAGMLR